MAEILPTPALGINGLKLEVAQERKEEIMDFQRLLWA